MSTSLVPRARCGVLGPVEVGGGRVDLGPPKQRAVLGALLLEPGEVVSTDRLLTAVWGETPPARALAGLQAYVSNLRRVLRGTALVERRAPGYRLRVEDGDVDVDLFRSALDRARAAARGRGWHGALAAATAAEQLWRGPLLADQPDLARQDWVVPRAVRLTEERSEAAELRVRALLGLGRTTEALTAARQLVLDRPLSDGATWLLVLALHRSGRTAEALEAHREHARALGEELGIDPGPELRQLQVQLLTQDPELDSWPGPASDGPLARSGPGAGDVVLGDGEAADDGADDGADDDPVADDADTANAPASPEVARAAVTGAVDTVAPGHADAALVGRAGETEVLAGLVADVRQGRARWLVLTGPPGIGKTRLAEEAGARLLAAGGREIWARCPEEESVPSWWPWRQVLRSLGSDPDTVLVPPPEAGADAARFTVYERVLQELRRAAEDGPVAVVVDDVQWADPVSLRCLAHLARELRHAAVLLVLTLRDGTSSPDLDVLLSTLSRARGVQSVPVPPLDVDAVGELLTGIAGEPVAREHVLDLAARTGGNPLFVCEYARLPRAERAGVVPAAVRTVLGRRLAALSAEALVVLRVGAVAGDLDPEVLARALGTDVDAVLDALDAAADEHLLSAERDGASFAFAHPLLREQVLAELSAPRRRRLHGLLAEALGGVAGPGPGGALQRWAEHLVAAQPLVDARLVVDACRRAAADADERWDAETAARRLEQALTALDRLPGSPEREDERDDLLTRRVFALARAGRGQTVYEVVGAALERAAREGRARTIGRLAAGLLRSSGAWPWSVYGRDPGVLLARLEAVQPVVDPDPVAAARVLAARAVGDCYNPDPAVPDGLSRRAVQIAEATGDDAALADALTGRVLTFVGCAASSAERVRLLERLVSLDHAWSPYDQVLRHNALTMELLNLGDAVGAAAHLRDGVRAGDRLRLPATRVQLRWMAATLAHWRGELDEASALARRASELHRAVELYDGGTTAYIGAAIHRDVGDLAARSDLPAGLGDGAVWRLVAAQERGELDAVRAGLAELVDVVTPFWWTTLAHQVLLAHAAAEVGDRSAASTLLARLAPFTGMLAAIGQVGVVGPVDLALGELHLTLGDEERGRALVRDALDLCRREGGRISALRCRLVLARLEPADRREAQLSGIVREAEQLGAGDVARRARSLLEG
ncbi:BTAD domain-containing putative transcriptional regulator [Kineococcus gynurae]|uniref:BTAD domain-containing putative transcriptional regulator n=1 Tax=Kineococcus gynurae TaxID=452979 RepID=A0ABV5LTQ4_9ACTN